MYIEDRLNSIEAKIDFLIKSGGAIPADESGIAGAGASPVVTSAQAAATAPKPRGRGRPPKSEPESGAPAAPPASAVAPPVAQPDPFALDGTPPAQAPNPRTLTEVKAALVAYQVQNSQEAALKLLKDTTGAETLAALAKADPMTFSTLFKAAIPADKFALSDVRAVLVAAEGRKTGAGREVLEKYGAKTIGELTEDKFVEAILAAHVAGR